MQGWVAVWRASTGPPVPVCCKGMCASTNPSPCHNNVMMDVDVVALWRQIKKGRKIDTVREVDSPAATYVPHRRPWTHRRTAGRHGHRCSVCTVCTWTPCPQCPAERTHSGKPWVVSGVHGHGVRVLSSARLWACARPRPRASATPAPRSGVQVTHSTSWHGVELTQAQHLAPRTRRGLANHQQGSASVGN